MESMEEGLIKVKKSDFWNLGIDGDKLNQLVESIGKKKDLDGINDQLQEVLKCIKTKPYGQDVNVTKQHRNDRIILYNHLLLRALTGDDWEEWDIGVKFSQSDAKNLVADFAPGSIYKYLLDQIHANDDIMFKYYQNKNDFRKSLHTEETFWLGQSMDRYRVHLTKPTLDILKGWKRQKELSQELLDEAKEKFRERVPIHPPSHAGDSESRWRYNARMYWLLARLKNATIGTFIPRLVQEIITEDHKVLLDKDKDSLMDERPKSAGNEDKKVDLGVLRFSSLLAYASAKNDYELVSTILQSKEQHVRTVRRGRVWEEAWKRAFADALWNAAYKGNGRIVKELLNCGELYSYKLYSGNNMKSPLHVAVLRGHIPVVEAFCSESQTQLSCHEKDKFQRDHQTPVEVATHLYVEVNTHLDKHTLEHTKRKFQSFLLQRPEVRQAVEESYRQRDLIVNSANAIMVGAALIASVTFGGWLQPPLGYHTYFQFTEPLPAPPDTFSSYLSIQGHTSVRVFAIFNSLSFFFAIASAVAGMGTFMAATVKVLDESYAESSVKELLSYFRVTTSLFVVSVISVLIAFGSAAIAILPPIPLYQTDMYITIGVGGFFCLVFIGWMLFVGFSKRPKKETKRMYSKIRSCS